MLLFDDIERTDSRVGKRSESLFVFLNRVERPEFARVRDLMEAWYARYPAESHTDIRARFRDGDPQQALGAFWELMLHELHLGLGFALDRDPVVPGTTKRPDFLATRGDAAFYLEATIVGYPDDEMARRRRRDLVLDFADEAFSPDFWVNIKVPVEGQTTPAKSQIKQPIEDWLAGLQWSAGEASPGSAPEFELRVRDWVLRLRAYPRTESLRGDPDFPTIGMGPSWAGTVDERAPIERSLREKASRYGKPDKPYVVAALCLRDFVTDQAIQEALYGPRALRMPVMGGVAQQARAEVVRDPRGLWQWGQNQRATRVSAVLSASHLNPWLIANANPILWKNPWAMRPFAEQLPFKTVVGDLDANELVVTEPTADAREILGLPEGWPYEPGATDAP
jgi:hypothetical protein